ncbi:MAG: hypothetical protein HN855_11690 [Anaerolineae bacterium]|jgi:hypothetical protein|nr:hypothetical protein [Anaerolineae bacterium]MBT7071013.1 hypothetical protein [Anaerolineae bacterium]MBT7325815.1 hypothetical protein [Anaerolineae bacterium]
MDYGKILGNAWKTVWKHKVILWFGMLMAIPTVLMGIVMGGFFYFFTEEGFLSALESGSTEPDAFLIFFIIFALSMVLLTILSYATMAFSFTGALKGTYDLRDEETSISFRELWDASLPFLWRIFGIIFIVFIAIFGFIGIFFFVGAIFGALTAGLGFLCLMPFILLLIPFELLAFLFAAIAMAVVIAEDIGVFDALRRAREIMKQKFWHLILMGIIVAFIVWATSMIVMLPMQFAQFAFMMPMMSDPYMQDPTTFFRPFAILMAVVMPLSGIVQGLSMSFANAVWIFSYLDITATPEKEPEEVVQLI